MNDPTFDNYVPETGGEPLQIRESHSDPVGFDVLRHLPGADTPPSPGPTNKLAAILRAELQRRIELFEPDQKTPVSRLAD